MAKSLRLGWRQITYALWAQVFFHHPKLSDIATQITRLRLFCFNTWGLFGFLCRYYNIKWVADKDACLAMQSHMWAMHCGETKTIWLWYPKTCLCVNNYPCTVKLEGTLYNFHRCIKILAWSVACEDLLAPIDWLLASTYGLVTNIYKLEASLMPPGWVSDLHLWLLVCCPI